MQTAWTTLTEKHIDDLASWVEEAARDGQTVHIGTDSLQTGRYTQYVTVVVVHTPLKGGRVAYSREVTPRVKSLRERLLRETWRSVEVALELHELVPGELIVHIDANTQERYASSRWVQELVGLVMGQGFKALIKPDAWAASHAADHIVRFHGKLPRSA